MPGPMFTSLGALGVLGGSNTICYLTLETTNPTHKCRVTATFPAFQQAEDAVARRPPSPYNDLSHPLTTVIHWESIHAQTKT